MELGTFELKKIHRYFNLENEILRIQYHIGLLREEFYSQSMSTAVRYTELGIVSKGFSPERNVIQLVDNILIKQKRIKQIRKKQRYFNDYLHSLDPKEKHYLINKYVKNIVPKNVQQADVNLYKEILEIEEAINFMNGHPPDPQVNISLDNETLQDDFNNITEMLGV